MKRLTIATLFLFTNFLFGQNYQFNLIANYESNYDGKRFEHIVLSNSGDQSFFLALQEKDAYLFDTKRLFRHNFKVKKGKDGKPVLTYRNSIKLDKVNPASDYTYRFETVREDSIQKVIKMIPLKNGQISGSEYVELVAKKINSNLFPTFRFACMHLYETRTDIDPMENLVIVNSRLIGSKQRDFELISLDESNLNIVIN